MTAAVGKEIEVEDRQRVDSEFGRAAAALVALRARRPLVACLTNTVAANFTANALLALGAVPAMVDDSGEASELAARADAVLVNVGTLTEGQATAMRHAISACRAAHVPWVLDPVAADRLEYRGRVVREFMRLSPALVRGNRGEMDWLRAHCPAAKCVRLSTDAEDVITCGERTLALRRGTPMLQRVTATGCAQGAIAAAFCAVADPWTAAVGAALAMALAGERAARRTRRPGSFQIALLDALDALTASALRRAGTEGAR